MTQDTPPVGLVLGSLLPPERIPHVAATGERLGFCELWLAEDYFFTGGISGATAALAATERIPVGLGIVSAVVRHPALLAMEVATISRMYPGRLLPGIGLGVPAWIQQMGLQPPSQLAALRESVTSVRRLLAGEELTETGRVFAFDRVKLTHPPAETLPIYLGVLGPKGLELSGEVADGTVVSVLASPAYVRWLRERTAAGAARGGRTGHHRVATFALCHVAKHGAAAKAAARATLAFYLWAVGPTALTEVYGVNDQLRDMLERGGADLIARELPDAWVDDLAIAGDPDEVATRIRALLDAGSDSVALFPVPFEQADEVIELAAAEVLPLLR
jgi:alkanesulfonate monooxygenase SsuD/methylene tetrahydromethanopterin reductase-like flavin-dependent oxidoreductase (luciferase family)